MAITTIHTECDEFTSIQQFNSIKNNVLQLKYPINLHFLRSNIFLKIFPTSIKRLDKVLSTEVLNVIKLLINDLLSNDPGMMFLKEHDCFNSRTLPFLYIQLIQ